MKLTVTKINNFPKLSLGFYFLFPDEDDYYSNHYSLSLELFGYYITFNLFKE